MNKNGISLALITLFTSTVSANSAIPDGRTGAMGNVGTATADYLAAPLFNPALVAVFDKSDDVGILLPGIGVNFNDQDSSIDTLDDLQDAIEDFENSNDPNDLNKIDGYLDELDGNAPIYISAGAVVAVAIPSNTVSVNMFSRGYFESFANLDISNDPDQQTRYEQSTVNLTGVGYVEFGIALAKQYKIAEEQFSFGITPKYQMLKTNFEVATVEDYDVEFSDENETSENAFNLDLGTVWLKNDFRAGLSLQNLIKQDITTKNGYTYEINPQATLGLAYATDLFTFGVDVDLTEQKRFKDIEDDTQFARAGLELNAWHWAQLRFGYEHDMNDTLDDSVTAGIGLSPFGTVNFDIAGSYASEEQAGVSASVSFTF